MPLYEYECERCGHRFEVIQKFSDPLVEVCPVCSGPVRKLMSSPAIQFKGTGWYITDYAKKDAGGAKSDGGKSDKGAADKPAGETTKNETAGETKSSKETKSSDTKSAEPKRSKDAKTTP